MLKAGLISHLVIPALTQKDLLMSVIREPLPKGMLIRLPDGFCAEITGDPLGEGGGSLIYPAVRIYIREGCIDRAPMQLAVKECFPASEKYRFRRDQTGSIVPGKDPEEGAAFLASVQAMQRREADVAGQIYNVASRMIPVLETAGGIELSIDGKTFRKAANTVTIMESLAGKGVALRSFIQENRRGISALMALRIIEQVLYALREVHAAGFLHLDLQDGNIFLKGNLKDASLQAALIDFGSSRPYLEDGLCAPITDKVLFATSGFSAPEMRKNDGSLRLSPAADIYSAGYLLLLLLTGKRYETEAIAGRYGKDILTPLRMRHTSCPSYLAGSLQEILRRSLAMDPQARYRSADEMLTAVTKLREALEPERSTLHAVHYDAFICYRHGDPDSLAVKTLQSALEHFHIPSEIRKRTGKKRFERIFTDLGELSACADLGTAIQDALTESDWLIVVCSKDTPSSLWVSQEIETFLETHDLSRIIPVLIEGEPDESFPKELLSDNKSQTMLAADARARTKEEMIRIIQKDTVLRLAAPMLGVSFDALRQRRQLYAVKRIASIAAASAALMAGFTAHTLYQSAQIRAAHRETLIRQGELLADKSEELLKQGDRLGAIRTALEALPENSGDNSKPVTDAAVYALNQASYAYWDSAFACFQSDGLLTPGTTITGVPVVNPEGTLMAVTDSAGRTYIYDLISMCQKGSFTLADIDTDCADETLSEMRLLSEDRMLLKTDSYILCLDPLNESLIWSTKITADPGGQPGDTKQSLLVSDDGRERFYLILPYGSNVKRQAVYPVLTGDLKTGALLGELDIPAGDRNLRKLQAGALSKNGRLLILGLSAVMDERPCDLMGIDLENGKILWEEELGKDIEIEELLVLDDHSAAALTKKQDFENSSRISHLKCFRPDDGSPLYEEESRFFYLQHQGLKRPGNDDDTGSVLVLWQQEHLKLLDTGSFLTLQEYQLTAPVLNVAPYSNNSLIAVLSDGSCWRIFTDSNRVFFCGSVEGTFSNVCAYENNGLHFLISGYASNRMVAMSEHDYEGFRQPDPGAGRYVSDVTYISAQDDWFRILSVSSGALKGRGEYLAIARAGSDDQMSTTDSEGYKTPIRIDQTPAEPALYYLKSEKREDALHQSLCAWGLRSNTLLAQSEELPASFSLCHDCSSDTHIVLYFGKELLLFSADDSKTAGENLTAPVSITLEEGQSLRKVTALPRSSSFLVQIHVSSSETRPEMILIKKLDAGTGRFTGSEINLEAHADMLAVSPDGALAVFREDNLFVIRDLASGRKTDTLPETCSTKARACFADEDHLLIWGDSGYLKSWDLSQKEIVMTDDTELIWVSQMIRDGEYLQIQTQNLNEDILFSRHSADPGVRIYKYYEDGRFAHYFDFAAGVACMQENELTSLGTKAGIARVMDLDQLIQRAKEIADNAK